VRAEFTDREPVVTMRDAYSLQKPGIKHGKIVIKGGGRFQRIKLQICSMKRAVCASVIL